MDSEKYWAKRADERERYWYRKSQETIEKELARYYASSLDEIQKDIQALYGRFAKDNQLSMTDARKLLQGQEYRKWRYSIDTYVKKINGGETGLLKELNTLAMRSRISRLDKLYSDTLMELDSLGRKTDSSMRSFLTDAYKDNYYHGMYAIGRTIGLKAPRVVVSSQSLEDVLRTRWSGKNYSERIWKNQKLLGSTLKQEMTTAIHRGESVQVISKRIANRMGVANSNATRLVRTELNYVENAAALRSIKDAGLGYYRFIATLDNRTTPICRAHDGRIVSVEEASPGDNLPPLHPNCRSTISGSLYGPDDDHKRGGTRIARTAKGKNYYVPADMTYPEWEETYVVEPQKLPKNPHAGKTVLVDITPGTNGGDTVKVYEKEKIPTLQDVTTSYTEKRTSEEGDFSCERDLVLSRHKDEIETARWICKNLGGDIVVLNELLSSGEKKADYLWRNKLWDLKTIHTEKAADSAIRHGLKQIEKNPGGIIFNVVSDEIDIELLQNIIATRLARSAKFPIDVIVLKDSKLIRVFRHTKK